jgi:hypothetical protein
MPENQMPFYKGRISRGGAANAAMGKGRMVALPRKKST